MKKILLLLCLCLSIVWSSAQIRFLRVDPTTDEIYIKNFGTTAVDISAYRLCSEFVYTSNLTSVNLVSGSLNLAGGDTVKLSGWALTDAAADLGLYLATGGFGDQNAMVDFTQWGAGGIGRESVAVAKGIWTAGAFVSGPAPYTYTGNGTQNGIEFWVAAPIVPDIIRFLRVDPTTDAIYIKNYGTSTVDISAYRLCSEFLYTSDLTSVTLVSGSLNLAPGDTVELSGWAITDSAADLGLYLATGAFSDTSALVDFLQWGAAGIGREAVAAAKGIWAAGDFIDGDAPFTYTGDGTENGLAFWMVTTGIFADLSQTGFIKAFPNPAYETVYLELSLPASLLSEKLSVSILDLQGREVRRIENISRQQIAIERGHLSTGTYLLRLRNPKTTLAVEKIRFR